MIRNDSSLTSKSAIGISAVSAFQPPWILPNEWFDSMPRKFVKHTGIRQRPVSTEDEVALSIKATQRLVEESGCDLNNCAGLVFTSPSFIPLVIARTYMHKNQVQREQLNRATVRLIEELGISPRHSTSTNTFCAGYAKALSIVKHKMMPTIDLQPNEFVLVLTASCISRITDYGCGNTAGLFGDLATATLIAETDSQQYPVHFELIDATVQRKPTQRPFFEFSVRDQVLTPDPDGGQRLDPRRAVFTMDGMGIADTAPRAMAFAASEMVKHNGLSPQDISYILPHQAGSAIVRLAEMKLRDEGFTAEVINGMTSDVGNVSSGSIPYSLTRIWNQIHGNILCPIASVGPPGKPLVAQGCIALRSTAQHQSGVELD